VFRPERELVHWLTVFFAIRGMMMTDRITPEIDRALRRALLSSVKFLGIIPRAKKLTTQKGSDNA
jgi:hypothetical protein